MSRYHEIASEVRARIEGGEFARGSRLPSYEELANEYNVSTPVISRAVAILRGEGLVRSIVGREAGTVVHEVPPILRNAVRRYTKTARESGDSRGAFATEVRALGFEPRSELVRIGPVTPPHHIAEALGLEVDEVTAIRERKMSAGDTPVQIATSYIPWDIAAGTVLTQQDTGVGGTYSRLEELGFRVARFTEQIHTRAPSAAEAAFLRLTDVQPVYAVLHIAYAGDGRPVEVTEHVMPTHQWKLEYEWSAD